MTFEELLKASASGLPQVEYNGRIGRVTVIKDHSFKDGGWHGCAVRFDKDYDEWFDAIPHYDKRRKYMRDLNLKPI